MIEGHCDERFQKIHQILEKQIENGFEIGASVALELEGKEVVNLYGGYSKPDKSSRWEQDTITNVWSVTKGVVGACVIKLIDEGKLDVNEKVQTYWPEYGCNGKQETTVLDFLCHRAGMYGFQNGYPKEPWTNWLAYTKELEAQSPFRKPGSSQSYHALTFGWLIGELFRRVDGRTVGNYFREEFAEPLKLDFHIGVKDQDIARCAEITFKNWTEENPFINSLANVPDAILNQNMKNFKDAIKSRDYAIAFDTGRSDDDNYPNKDDWRKGEVPSANGHGTAASLAKLFGIMSTGCERDGVRLFDESILNKAIEVHSRGPDTVLFGSNLKFGYCFMLEQKSNFLGDFVPTFKKTAFGHAGAGGAVAFGDKEKQIGFAFVGNRQQDYSMLYRTANKLIEEIYSILK